MAVSIYLAILAVITVTAVIFAQGDRRQLPGPRPRPRRSLAHVSNPPVARRRTTAHPAVRSPATPTPEQREGPGSCPTRLPPPLPPSWICSVLTAASPSSRAQARGLGKALSLALAEAGADIVAIDIGDLDDVAAQVRARGVRCAVRVADLSGLTPQAATELISWSRDQLGQVAIFVNDAEPDPPRTCDGNDCR